MLLWFCDAGKDLIGLAQTGSGKTGAFALPILQALLEIAENQRTVPAFFACVLSPTRWEMRLLNDLMLLFCSFFFNLLATAGSLQSRFLSSLKLWDQELALGVQL